MADRIIESAEALARLPLSLAGSCTIALAPVHGRISFRGGAEAAARAGAALGLSLPQQPMAADAASGRAVLWLGPDEWLILSEADAPPALLAALGARLDMPFSAVDVSQRQVGLVVEGPGAARLLSAGCPLDLHITAFAAGQVARTVFHKAEITLWRQGTARFHLEVGRSFAPYLLGMFAEVAPRLP